MKYQEFNTLSDQLIFTDIAMEAANMSEHVTKGKPAEQHNCQNP